MKQKFVENTRAYGARLMAEASRDELAYLAKDIKDGDVKVVGDIEDKEAVLISLWPGQGYYLERFLVTGVKDFYDAGTKLAPWLRNNYPEGEGEVWYDPQDALDGFMNVARHDINNEEELVNFAYATYENLYTTIGEDSGYEVAVYTENFREDELSETDMVTLRELLK